MHRKHLTTSLKNTACTSGTFPLPDGSKGGKGITASCQNTCILHAQAGDEVQARKALNRPRTRRLRLHPHLRGERRPSQAFSEVLHLLRSWAHWHHSRVTKKTSRSDNPSLRIFYPPLLLLARLLPLPLHKREDVHPRDPLRVFWYLLRWVPSGNQRFV